MFPIATTGREMPRRRLHSAHSCTRVTVVGDMVASLTLRQMQCGECRRTPRLRLDGGLDVECFYHLEFEAQASSLQRVIIGDERPYRPFHRWQDTLSV
jgi:hypothetical protein